MEGEEQQDDYVETLHNCNEDQKHAGEDLEILINAISGFPSNNAMRLLGKIGSFTLEILVDSGSIHNFLDPLVVEATKLRIQKDSSL